MLNENDIRIWNLKDKKFSFKFLLPETYEKISNIGDKILLYKNSYAPIKGEVCLLNSIKNEIKVIYVDKITIKQLNAIDNNKFFIFDLNRILKILDFDGNLITEYSMDKISSSSFEEFHYLSSIKKVFLRKFLSHFELWEIEKGELIKHFWGNQFCISDGQKTLVIYDGKCLQLYDLKNNEDIAIIYLLKDNSYFIYKLANSDFFYINRTCLVNFDNNILSSSKEFNNSHFKNYNNRRIVYSKIFK